jgi:hypothetical protein
MPLLYRVFGRRTVKIGGLNIWITREFVHVFWQTQGTIDRWLKEQGYDRSQRKA